MGSYEERIRDARHTFSPSFERLAAFLLDGYAQAAFQTATELAHTLDIDTATVVRFAQRLGYPGYPELQREIRRKVKRELFDEHRLEPGSAACVADEALSELARSLELTRRSFPTKTAQALINALDKATRVILMAEALALPAARTLGAWLEAAGYTIHLAGGSPAELARAVAGVHTGDLILALEVTAETPYVARAMSEARRREVCTAALVAAPSSEVACHADMVLAAHASPEEGVRQVLLEAMVYGLVRMLAQARPGRFGEISARVGELTRRLTAEVVE